MEGRTGEERERERERERKRGGEAELVLLKFASKEER